MNKKKIGRLLIRCFIIAREREREREERQRLRERGRERGRKRERKRVGDSKTKMQRERVKTTIPRLNGLHASFTTRAVAKNTHNIAIPSLFSIIFSNLFRKSLALNFFGQKKSGPFNSFMPMISLIF